MTRTLNLHRNYPQTMQAAQESLNDHSLYNMALYQTLLNQPHESKTQQTIDCSSFSTPCPEGCQEIADCSLYAGRSCGIPANLFQYTLAQIISTYECSCKCKMAESTINDDETIRTNLLQFYNSSSGEDWFISTNWLSNTSSYCSFFGVYCDSTHRISAIGMISNNVIGSISSTFFTFPSIQSSLVIYAFPANYMTGTIPSSIFGVNVLQYVHLTSNILQGTFSLHAYLVHNYLT